MTHLTDNLLNEYLDNVLDEASRQNAEIHLAECSNCTDRLNSLKHAFEMLNFLDEQPLGNALAPEILAKISIKNRSIPFVWRLALAAQAGIGLGILLSLGKPFLIYLPEPRTILDRILALWLLIPNPMDFQLKFPVFPLPTFNLPLKMEAVIAIAIAVTLLWVVGNAALLCSKPEVRK